MPDPTADDVPVAVPDVDARRNLALPVPGDSIASRPHAALARVVQPIVPDVADLTVRRPHVITKRAVP